MNKGDSTKNFDNFLDLVEFQIFLCKRSGHVDRSFQYVWCIPEGNGTGGEWLRLE